MNNIFTEQYYKFKSLFSAESCLIFPMMMDDGFSMCATETLFKDENLFAFIFNIILTYQ